MPAIETISGSRDSKQMRALVSPWFPGDGFAEQRRIDVDRAIGNDLSTSVGPGYHDRATPAGTHLLTTAAPCRSPAHPSAGLEMRPGATEGLVPPSPAGMPRFEGAAVRACGQSHMATARQSARHCRRIPPQCPAGGCAGSPEGLRSPLVRPNPPYLARCLGSAGMRSITMPSMSKNSGLSRKHWAKS